MSDNTVWFAIFMFGLIGLNWPLLEVFHDAVFGYLLIFWLLLVALVACAARGSGTPPAR